MKCPYCDNSIPPGETKCPACGAVAPAENWPQELQPQNFAQESLETFKKILTKEYFCFEGRMSKREYLLFLVPHVVLLGVIFFLGFGGHLVGFSLLDKGGRLLFFVAFLGTLLPALGAGARRLHDTGKSALLLLGHLLCCAGTIAVLVFSLMEGQKESNQYGEVPSK